jgi:hypothetical protein
VKNIPGTVSEDEFRKKFSDFEVQISSTEEDGQKKTAKIPAKITSLTLKDAKIFGDSPVSKYAFVMYDTVQAAQRAIQLFNDALPFGGTKTLLVEFWQSKEEKEKERKLKEERINRNLINTLL